MTQDSTRPGPFSQGLLRVLTCGSVDSGKSTLIGRILVDTGSVPADIWRACLEESRRSGTTGDAVDLSFLADGLADEIHQGITIDLAHRYVRTATRRFILVDAPGHEQYTRNMVTGASKSEVAVLLVDVRKGLLTQTKRHAHICALLGVRHLVVAVNKMDVVGYDPTPFRQIEAAFARFIAPLRFHSVYAVPISARRGDHVVHAATHMNWFAGPPLLEHLETIAPEEPDGSSSFRFPVQWINRPNAEFRGASGTIAAGGVRVGDCVTIAGSARPVEVCQMLGASGDVDAAVAGDAVTLRFTGDVDLARGDVLCGPDDPPAFSDRLRGYVIWMDEEPLVLGRRYDLRFGHQWVPGAITALLDGVDLDTLEPRPVTTLALNDIAHCEIRMLHAVAFDPYDRCRNTGGFLVVDRLNKRTVACGVISAALQRSTNVRPEELLVHKGARAARNGQPPMVIWFTGLPGAGKSTLAKRLEQRLFAAGRQTYLLDGDNLRHGLNSNLGFSDADRVENVRRAGEVAKLMADAGLIVICAFVSPFAAERQAVRDLLDDGEFVEVFVDTPIEECIRRDPKGLYARALSGAIAAFTGVDSPYQPPTSPDLRLPTVGTTPDELVEVVLRSLRARGVAC